MIIAGIVALAVAGCGGTDAPSTAPPAPNLSDGPTPTSVPDQPDLADVIDVSVSGSPGDYSLSVTVSSPDTGCDSYADWWEAVSEDGELLTRRVLLHAHVNDQPFTRSMGDLKVQPSDTVIIRAHMSVDGYGGSIMRGTVAGGFLAAEVSPGFAAGLETQRPLPADCAF